MCCLRCSFSVRSCSAMFVVCSFWKTLWKFANALNTALVRCVRWKTEIPLTCKIKQKNVVGEVFKCGQKLYTWHFTSHNIYRSIRKGALFHFSSVRRARSLWSTHTAIILTLLCFSTTQSANRCASLQELLQLLVLPVSKQCSLSLYIRDLYIKEHIEISSCF